MSLIRRDAENAKHEQDLAVPISGAHWPDDRIDRVFRDMFRSMFAPSALADRFPDVWGNSLHVEEMVEGSTYVIRAELPGIDPDKDVEISVDDGVLQLTARRLERSQEDRPDHYRSEFRYGVFERSFRLPRGVPDDAVTATYKDGILEVRVPVDESAKAVTKIAVEHG